MKDPHPGFRYNVAAWTVARVRWRIRAGRVASTSCSSAPRVESNVR